MLAPTRVHSTLLSSNYSRLFALYKSGNQKMTRVLRYFLPELRMRCITTLLISHVDGLPLTFLREVLHFAHD
jgi:hypothetical protein